MSEYDIASTRCLSRGDFGIAGVMELLSDVRALERPLLSIEVGARVEEYAAEWLLMYGSFRPLV